MLSVFAAILRSLNRCEALRIDHTFGGALRLQWPGMQYRDPLHFGWPLYREYDGRERDFDALSAEADAHVDANTATGPVYHIRRGVSWVEIERWSTSAAQWPISCLFCAARRTKNHV